MLVKKIDPEWFPSENKYLQVGEYVDLSDPRELILAGTVVGIVDGLEASAYELYGVMTEKELAEFKEFVQYKKIKQLKERQAELQTESKELKEQLTTTTEKTEEKPASSNDKRIDALKKAREAKLAKKNG